MARAVASSEPILLFGDYDVDGTTATAVLYEFLRACGARVSYYIPHRLKEGYGLQPRHIAEVAVPRGAKLLITVDCGSGSHAAADAAACGWDRRHHHRPSHRGRPPAAGAGRHQPQAPGLHRSAWTNWRAWEWRFAWPSRCAGTCARLGFWKDRRNPI